MIRDLIDRLGDLPPELLLLMAAALAFAETAILLDLIIPGEAGMVIVGAAAADAGVSLWLVAAAATVGAAAGDGVSFALGRSAVGWMRKRGRAHRRLAAARARTERHFERFGAATVFIGRWIGALRAVVPFVAGGSGMRVRTFVAWNVLASVTWATTIVGIGHHFGRSVAEAVERVDRWLALAVVVVAVVLVVRGWHRRRTSGPVALHG